jgi:CubicO group peptidase (beta-lactamase class C family)
MNDLELTKCIEDLNTAHNNCIEILIISSNGKDSIFSFKNNKNSIYEVRSISKLVVSLCIGIAIESKMFCINSRIWDKLKLVVKLWNQDNLKYIEKITVKDLLTQSAGYIDDNLMFYETIKDKDCNKMLDYICNVPLVEEPGKKFVYSNASAFLLSAYFHEVSGENLYEFSKRVLFTPLKINPVFWINYGKYCAGATGLSLSAYDVHKLGKLVLNLGNWEGERIVSEKYICELSKVQISIDFDQNNHSLEPIGYGYFTWISRKGFFYISGAKGRYVIIDYNRKFVITAIANQDDTMPVQKFILNLISCNRHY